VDKVNACDALIVGGAVMFREDHIRFKMPVGITKPVVFYGVSYRTWNDDSHYFAYAGFYDDVYQILQHPKVIMGVRNDGTEKWMWQKLGSHDDRIVTIPDSGLYVETENREFPQGYQIGRTNIVVALNGEDSSERFGAKTFIVLGNIAKAMTMFWEQDRSVNFILSPHTYQDYDVAAAISSRLPTEMLHQNVVSTGINRADQAHIFYDLYSWADLILAMRIHAMVPAIGLGTPMIALSSQKRMTEFMKDAGLEYYYLNIFDKDLSGLLYNRIRESIKYPGGVKTDFTEAGLAMRARTKAFNEKIYNFIKEGI